MTQHVYVKLTRPEGYEDVHPGLVIEDAGIKAVFEPEDVTDEVEALRQSFGGLVNPQVCPLYLPPKRTT